MPRALTATAEVSPAGLSIPEAIRLYGAVVTAAQLVRALAARIDDDGRLSLDGQWADDLSLVALALDDVLGGDEGDG